MSFSFGSTGSFMGPRGALDQFGEDQEEGAFFNRRVVFRLAAYLKPYLGRVGLAVLAMLVSSGLTLLLPYLLKVAIDQHIAQNDLPGLRNIALIMAGAYLGVYAATSVQQYLLSWVSQRLLANLRGDMFRHLQALSIGYHDTHIIGVTVSRVINDVAVINDLLSQGWVTLLGDLLVLAGTLVVMLTINPGLALLTFIVLPLMLGVTYWFAVHARQAFRETRSRVAAVIGDMAEELAGMRVIQAFAQEKSASKRFKRVNLANRNAYINAMSLSFVFLPAVEFLAMLATAIVLYFGGRAVMAGSLTVGVVAAFLSYVTRFFQPIQELSRIYTTMQAAMAGGERVVELLDVRPDVQDLPGAIELPAVEGLVRFENVSFRYRPGLPEVLHDVSFEIQPGQTIALVGPTGAGKTSIANLVGRFYEVSEGTVSIDGFDVRSVTQASLHRQIGLVPQDAFLFPGTIADNIRFGCPNASDEEVEAAARTANAHDFIADLPDGYQSEILQGGSNLSVGQRQLLCIARALLNEPRILIMDEATASVDTLTEYLIQEALARLLEGRTAIIIAHRLSTVRSADRIFVIDDGRIVEQGSHEQLLAAGGLYKSLHDRQFVDVETRQGGSL